MRIITLLFLFISTISFSQNYILKGKVKNASTGEGVAFATVKVEALSMGATTDFDGNYSLSLKAGQYLLKIECFGYQTATVTVSVEQDMKYDFKLPITL